VSELICMIMQANREVESEPSHNLLLHQNVGGCGEVAVEGNYWKSAETPTTERSDPYWL